MADATTTAGTTRPGAADEGATAGAAKCKSVGCYTINFGETDAASGSLQSAFAKYRQEKAKALELRAGPAKRERSDDEKQALREKFLARCRHYLGVPYKKRYFDEGTPEYESPIFLDCCGLVRRVMWDLQEDFGFRLGGWNQAYQWDTLADAEVSDPSQLKPGDLVFYAGDYTRPSAKQQKFRMVHVEVWLGGETGEATLGARWKKGKVSEFPSYKFESSSWGNVEMHFCSLEPWLRGECMPKHTHMWRMRSFEWMRNEKSVFSDAAGESAGGPAAEEGEGEHCQMQEQAAGSDSDDEDEPTA
ncbi:hypothetical protein FNF27_05807 [Cafeteria roenbergensis]|uniref:NlpC/P60 domain-containing protein n=1 Tax=Cafeteria roenbergensis TaxID=33653 RepID=A0A5A8E793_CAFRO|nr:hypothetical protein FNF27_05807 [Cafeteria roenbergensis]